MKIFFENYRYPYDVIAPYFEGRSLETMLDSPDREGKVATGSIGYLFVKNDKYDGPIFILPKTFLAEDNNGKITVFGLLNALPENCVDTDSTSSPLYFSDYGSFLPELGLWLYQALRRFKDKYRATTIIDEAQLDYLSPKSDSVDKDFLETALRLVDFLRDHRNLFTPISLINHSGKDRIDWTKTIATRTAYKFDGDMYYLEPCIKDKTINIDEELLVLYYSILNYLKKKYHFPIQLGDTLYELKSVTEIQNYIDNGTGAKTMQRIRHRYFRDDLKELWTLVNDFFSYNTTKDDDNPLIESTLVRNFNIVFEDMIDELIGDRPGSISESLKHQKDNKLIDHIFRFRSVVSPKYDIFYIGDSKYYATNHSVTGAALYKQYDYAHNVIQDQINEINRKTKKDFNEPGSLRYRDTETEGYNVTPNFFIRSIVRKDNLSYDKPDLSPTNEDYPVNKHFEDRLFDRDTLFIREYTINILFVIYAYVAEEDHKFLLRNTIRKDIISFLNDNYEFYKLDADYIDIDTPQGTVSPKFIDYFYKILTGKIYKEDEYGSLILAFEKHPKDKTAKDRILSELTPYLNKPIEQFELQDRID